MPGFLFRIWKRPKSGNSQLSPWPLIADPTASGKSDLAISIAQAFDREIASYGSVQVFRHFNIGSAKPAVEERQRTRVGQDD